MTNFQLALLSLIIFIIILGVFFTYWLPNILKNRIHKVRNKQLKSSSELIDTHLFMLRLTENLNAFDAKGTPLETYDFANEIGRAIAPQIENIESFVWHFNSGLEHGVTQRSISDKRTNKQVKTNKIKKNDDSELVVTSAIVLASSSCKNEESSNSYDSGSSDSGDCD